MPENGQPKDGADHDEKARAAGAEGGPVTEISKYGQLRKFIVKALQVKFEIEPELGAQPHGTMFL